MIKCNCNWATRYHEPPSRGLRQAQGWATTMHIASLPTFTSIVESRMTASRLNAALSGTVGGGGGGGGVVVRSPLECEIRFLFLRVVAHIPRKDAVHTLTDNMGKEPYKHTFQNLRILLRVTCGQSLSRTRQPCLVASFLQCFQCCHVAVPVPWFILGVTLNPLS